MLRGYQRSWLRGDLLAGVTVAAYLVPQVMAYATVAGLPPVTGLWAALPALVVYALLGSSPSLSMGPEATTALMTAIAITPLAAGDPARYADLATTLALLVGLMSVGAGLLRLGFVADLLSRPVLVGWMAGVALIMIADQLRRVTGVPVTGQEFFAQLDSFAHDMGRTAGDGRHRGSGAGLPPAAVVALATHTRPASGRTGGHCRRGRVRPAQPRSRHRRPDPGGAAGSRAA
jgi:sulfate permease, SulP family